VPRITHRIAGIVYTPFPRREFRCFIFSAEFNNFPKRMALKRKITPPAPLFTGLSAGLPAGGQAGVLIIKPTLTQQI